MGFIGRFILDKTLEVVVEKMVENGTMEKAADKLGSKMNKLSKTPSVEEIISDNSFDNHLIVEKIKSRDDKKCFYIYDADDNLQYTVQRPATNWKYDIHIFNSNRQQIGAIHEHKPFFKEVYEVEERTCDIDLNGKHIGQVRTYEASTGIEMNFTYNDFSVKKNLLQTKTEIFQKGKLVCRIYRRHETNDSKGIYVISYNNKEYAEAFVLFTVAMNKICFSNY